jgi:hypothetical protein
LTLPALKQLAAIRDTRIRESISRRINALENNPEEQRKIQKPSRVSDATCRRDVAGDRTWLQHNATMKVQIEMKTYSINRSVS